MKSIIHINDTIMVKDKNNVERQVFPCKLFDASGTVHDMYFTASEIANAVTRAESYNGNAPEVNKEGK